MTLPAENLALTRAAQAPSRIEYHSWTSPPVAIGILLLLFLTAPLFSPYRVTELAGDPLEAPSWSHLLGTNSVGQDVASQMLSGMQVSLLVALLAGGGTLILGGLAGMVAGLAGGMTDAAVMRAVDIVLVVPKLPLLIVLGAYAGQDLATVAAVIALTSWPSSARVVRAQVLSIRRRTHLKAAIGFGAGMIYLLRRHVLPEIGLILVAGLVTAAGRAVMLEAGLAFLGLGDPARASWGAIMRDALKFQGLFFTSAWIWWLLPPLSSIILLLLGLTYLGIVIEERLNPRLSRHFAAADK
jgi:ABC-type dipeptide/oligopeptide/nickel transport system permease subunit